MHFKYIYIYTYIYKKWMIKLHTHMMYSGINEHTHTYICVYMHYILLGYTMWHFLFNIHITVQRFAIREILFNTFIQQGSDSKDIYDVIKYLYLKNGCSFKHSILKNHWAPNHDFICIWFLKDHVTWKTRRLAAENDFILKYIKIDNRYLSWWV